MTHQIEKLRKIFSNVFVVMTFGCFFSLIVSFIAPTTVHATLATPDSESVGVGVAIPGTGVGSLGEYKFSVYVRAIYAFSMKVAVALATLMVVYAGYKYLTSRGESGAINEAKDILFSTLMGAALLMLVVLVGHIAGLDIQIIP